MSNMVANSSRMPGITHTYEIVKTAAPLPLIVNRLSSNPGLGVYMGNLFSSSQQYAELVK
jgi:hypothetical protein